MPGRARAAGLSFFHRGASAAGPFWNAPGARVPARRCRDGTPGGRRGRPTPASCCLLKSVRERARQNGCERHPARLAGELRAQHWRKLELHRASQISKLVRRNDATLGNLVVASSATRLESRVAWLASVLLPLAAAARACTFWPSSSINYDSTVSRSFRETTWSIATAARSATRPAHRQGTWGTLLAVPSAPATEKPQRTPRRRRREGHLQGA